MLSSSAVLPKQVSKNKNGFSTALKTSNCKIQTDIHFIIGSKSVVNKCAHCLYLCEHVAPDQLEHNFTCDLKLITTKILNNIFVSSLCKLK